MGLRLGSVELEGPQADPYTGAFLGQIPGPIVPGQQLRDETRTERFAAQNGRAEPVYAAEELLLGGAALNKVAGVISRALGVAEIQLAGKVEASTGGNIRTRQMTESGMSATLTSGERAVLASLEKLPNTALQGEAREIVADTYFIRNGFTKLDGKCGSGNCFDGVYIKGDKIYINEVKPLNADGSIKLSGENQATGLKTQMTDDWIKSAVSRLKSGNAEQQATGKLLENTPADKLVKIVSGVNSNGMTIVKLK